MKGQVLASFLIGLVFATSASADLLLTPRAEAVSGGSLFPPHLVNRELTDPQGPNRDYSPGFGLKPPSLQRVGPAPADFAYPDAGELWDPWQQNIRFECVNFLYEPGVGTMTLAWHRRSNTYGHNHSRTSGPAGTFNGHDSPYVFATGPGTTVLYQTSDFSGVIDVTMECNGNLYTQPLVIGVGVRGLKKLDASYGPNTFELVGQTCEDLDGQKVSCDDCTYEWYHIPFTGNCHVSDNGQPRPNTRHASSLSHYGVPALLFALQDLAQFYSAATHERLRINDMSLIYGGSFDIYADWDVPHEYHSLGIDADLGVSDRTTYTDDQGRVQPVRPLALILIEEGGLRQLVEYKKDPNGIFTKDEDLSHLHVVLKEWS